MDRPSRMVNARIVALAASVALGGCSYLPEVGMPSFASLPPLPGLDLFDSPRQIRGHLVETEELGQLVVGTSSRQDVEALLGSPSATGTFDESEWFYIGGMTRQRPGRELAIEDQRVVRIRFDRDGRLAEVTRLGPEDGRQIAVVRRVTPSPGNERTVLQQLFGNIGRVGPGIGAQQSGPGPSAPSN